MRPGMLPSCGPLSSSRMASEKRSPVRAAATPRATAAASIRLSGAALVVVAPTSPVGDLGGEGLELGRQGHGPGV